MRHFSLLALLVFPILILAACGSEDTSVTEQDTAVPVVVQVVAPSATPEPGKAGPAVGELVAPTGTSEPARERPYRSYPAPTGYPGFRVYYQKRCYPGCHSYPTASALEGVPPSTLTPEASSLERERPYRSYPAPTGYPGFRVYYQKRCYPGCHSYSSAPAPTQVHP